MENDITVIFVSFHSEDIIEKSIATINHNIPIIVIENSRNLTFKEKLEKKYPNIKVIIPEKNLGNGAGINHGIKNIETKYVFYLDVDTELFPDTIKNLMNAAKEINAVRTKKVRDALLLDKMTNTSGGVRCRISISLKFIETLA